MRGWKTKFNKKFPMLMNSGVVEFIEKVVDSIKAKESYEKAKPKTNQS